MKYILFAFLFMVGVSFQAICQNSDTVNPVFPGAETGLYNYISSKVKLPEASRLLYSSGEFLTTYLVDELGETTDIKIVPDEDERIVEHLFVTFLTMPKWKAGTANGVPIEVRYYIPVRFKISTIKEKKQKIYATDSIYFKYHKSAEVTKNGNTIRINGKFKAGDIIIRKEIKNFSLHEKLESLPPNFKLTNNAIELIKKDHAILNGYHAEVIVGHLKFNNAVSSFIGNIEVKIYKLKVKDSFYSITMLDFIEDLEKNHNQNALIMSTLEFK